MAAATASIATRTRGIPYSRIAFPVNALSQIYKGALVALDSTGHAVAATDAAGTNGIIGIAGHDALGGASDGDTWVAVLSGCAFELTASSITQAMLGTVMYVVDDATFDDAAGATNELPCGVLVEFISVTKGFIWIPSGGFNIDVPNLSVGTADLVDGAVTSVKLEASLVRFTDTQLTATEVKTLAATNIEVVPSPGATLAVFPIAVHIFLDHGGNDYVQVNNSDQLALIYNGSNEIMEIATEAQITALMEAGADAAIFDPADLVGFIPEVNKAIDLDNNGAAEYTTGDGTLSIRVYYVTVPMAAFS